MRLQEYAIKFIMDFYALHLIVTYFFHLNIPLIYQMNFNLNKIKGENKRNNI